MRISDDSSVRTGRRWAIRIVKVLLSTGLIVWIVSRTEPQEIFRVMGSAFLPLVLLAFSLSFVGISISISRWRVLLRAQGTVVRLWYLVQSYLSAIFFNHFLPSTIGGDGLRIYDSWRAGGHKTNAVTVVFVDRLLGTVALVAYSLLALALMHNLPVEVPVLTGGVLAFAGCMVVATWMLLMAPDRIAVWMHRLLPAFAGPVRRLTTRVTNSLMIFQSRKSALGIALALSFLLQLNVVLHYFLIAQAIALPVPLQAFFLIIPISLVIMMLPISVNAIGVRESVFAFFLGSYGVSAAEAIAFAWIAYGFALSQGVIGGIVYACRKEGRIGSAGTR